MKNNLILAVVGGIAAAIVGASVWAGITVVTGYQIGFMAIGVGFLVGIGVRTLGKGETKVFGMIGAVFALLGCLLGNLLTGIAMIAKEYELGFMDTLLGFDYTAAPEVLGAMFSPLDLLFYGLAVFQGFKVSIVQDVGGEAVPEM